MGEDLQDNAFTALQVLGEGLVETNDLYINPIEEGQLADLKEHSLVLLYRLMFVWYAESRGLIDPEDPRAATEYEENFSLDALRREVIGEVGERADERDFEREFSSYATGLWGRLEDLFSLVDSGNDELGIPAYNGGLFDENDHEFLAENEVADRHLAEVIYRLSTTKADSGFEKLRVTAARLERDSERLRVLAIPYVKPKDAGRGEYETLDPAPAMDFFDLDLAQADLIEAFVPHAVENEDAGYRDNATKSISPLDRLEDLTLPKLDDVAGGIERYMDAKERATELD